MRRESWRRQQTRAIPRPYFVYFFLVFLRRFSWRSRLRECLGSARFQLGRLRGDASLPRPHHRQTFSEACRSHDQSAGSRPKRTEQAAQRGGPAGDGTFGEIIPGETSITDSGYIVARGPIATVEIGIEV